MSPKSDSFFLACIEGNVPAVAEALKGDLSLLKSFGMVHPNHRDFMKKENADGGWSPLHLAAHYGQFEVVKLLVAAGSDLNAKAKNEIANTPLMAAVAGGQKEIIAFLLRSGADPRQSDGAGMDAAQLAMAEGKKELAEFIKDFKK